jgi:hypothetical protein
MARPETARPGFGPSFFSFFLARPGQKKARGPARPARDQRFSIERPSELMVVILPGTNIEKKIKKHREYLVIKTESYGI